MGQETQDNIYTPKLDSVLILVFLILPRHLIWSRYCNCDAKDAMMMVVMMQTATMMIEILYILRHSQMMTLPVIWTWDSVEGGCAHYITPEGSTVYTVLCNLTAAAVKASNMTAVTQEREDYPSVASQNSSAVSRFSAMGSVLMRQGCLLCGHLNLSGSAILRSVWLSDTDPTDTIRVQVLYHSH